MRLDTRRDQQVTATILDVAALAGVSRTTVSRVMNEPERVTVRTLERVRAAAASLNYHPSAAARTLRSGRTGTIALVVGDISQPFHGALAQAVAGEADRRNMSVVFHDLAHREERLVAVLDKLATQGIDAVVICTADALDSDRSTEAMAILTAQGIPAINSLGGAAVPGMLTLGLDHADSSHAATVALSRAGARSIGLLLGNPDDSYSRQLGAGYRAALAEVGLAAADRELVLTGGYSFERARAAVAGLLDAGTPLDALVVANTPMALGALRAAGDGGLSIPRDLMLICCEDVELAGQVSPGIATLAVEVATSGREIMVLLDQALQGLVPVPDKLLPVLRHRESFLSR
ncbi:LacI family DNA-binding transcriptional regulator [Paeniglutamicibacter cryotolerans]|uniref:DNA-binding LacI/PurR family transcriptional regulator n=1 Tax=Paeniglutamicibacter cryotolerans TaxID=670079 RepID=A0A839QKQ0_9MICC|nr:LacI family DNA-binding transcriptional regulator [Paeniglutamicibacter cryotolerans]MBB2996978.1 DNA-binding LacI/PurR family transcriptional regulator [Paeniglutamicibacter cryotolerans]